MLLSEKNKKMFGCLLKNNVPLQPQFTKGFFKRFFNIATDAYASLAQLVEQLTLNQWV